MPPSAPAQDTFRQLVAAAGPSGFTWVAQQPTGSSVVQQKWAWAATASGAQLYLGLNTDIDGGRSLGPGSAYTTVLLFFVRGPASAGMGQARVQCMGGCKCTDATLDTRWSQTTSYASPFVLKVGAGVESALQW